MSDLPIPPAFFDRRLMTAAQQPDGRWLIGSDFSDPFGHWAMTRMAAMATASRCGVPMAPHELHKKGTGLLIDAPGAKNPGLLMPWGSSSGSRGFEEQGGLGLEACFKFIDEQSSAPIADVHLLLRWSLVSYMLGHSEQHAGHVVLEHRREHGHSARRLAPFSWITTFPASASAGRYPLAKGMKIGNSWPDDFLMLHHWIRLCEWAGVKPKILLSMSKEIAEKIEAILREELVRQYKTEINMGSPTRVLQMVAKRTQRMRELYLTAPGQKIAGIKRIPLTAPNPAPASIENWD